MIKALVTRGLDVPVKYLVTRGFDIGTAPSGPSEAEKADHNKIQVGRVYDAAVSSVNIRIGG